MAKESKETQDTQRETVTPLQSFLAMWSNVKSWIVMFKY
jgi:hypothetical protein